jgi:hypothetical protein
LNRKLQIYPSPNSGRWRGRRRRWRVNSFQIPQVFLVLKDVYLTYNSPKRRDDSVDLLNGELLISLILLREGESFIEGGGKDRV